MGPRYYALDAENLLLDTQKQLNELAKNIYDIDIKDANVTILAKKISALSQEYDVMIEKYLSALNSFKNSNLGQLEQQELANMNAIVGIKSNLDRIAKELNNNKKQIFLVTNTYKSPIQDPEYIQFTEKVNKIKNIKFDPKTDANESYIKLCKQAYMMHESVNGNANVMINTFQLFEDLLENLSKKTLQELPTNHAYYLEQIKINSPYVKYVSPWGDITIDANNCMYEMGSLISSAKENSPDNLLELDIAQKGLQDRYADLVDIVPPNFACFVKYFGRFIPLATSKQAQILMLEYVKDINDKIVPLLSSINAFYTAILNIFALFFPYIYLSSLPVDHYKEIVYQLPPHFANDKIMIERYARMPNILKYAEGDIYDWIRYDYLTGKDLVIPPGLQHNEPLFIK